LVKDCLLLQLRKEKKFFAGKNGIIVGFSLASIPEEKRKGEIRLFVLGGEGLFFYSGNKGGKKKKRYIFRQEGHVPVYHFRPEKGKAHFPKQKDPLPREGEIGYLPGSQGKRPWYPPR